ncbi:MAG: IS66 family insertion sequence element accessory protein TnpB [Verrucomicrobiales bacterium]|nr:IS66 family insertion sequence element accessory protein TnpB [Verrucomicrobiales bacterium]
MKPTTSDIAGGWRRHRTTLEERQRWIAAWEQSQQTQAQFAASHGLSVATLRNWLRHPGSDAKRDPARPRFIEVDLGRLMGPGIARFGGLGVRDPYAWRLGRGGGPRNPGRAPASGAGGRGMLTIGGTTRVFLAVQPVDLRGSFDRLYGYVTEVLREDPRSGHWYGFVNKRQKRVS